MKTLPQALATAFWYARFRQTLSEKDFIEASECFKRYQYWKRRMKVNEMLDEICDRVKEGSNGK